MRIMHWVRDTAWREDVSKIRTGAAPRVMASLRNAVLEIWPEGPAEHHRKPAPKAGGLSRWRYYKRPKDIRIRTPPMNSETRSRVGPALGGRVTGVAAAAPVTTSRSREGFANCHQLTTISLPKTWGDVAISSADA